MNVYACIHIYINIPIYIHMNVYACIYTYTNIPALQAFQSYLSQQIPWTAGQVLRSDLLFCCRISQQGTNETYVCIHICSVSQTSSSQVLRLNLVLFAAKINETQSIQKFEFRIKFQTFDIQIVHPVFPFTATKKKE